MSEPWGDCTDRDRCERNAWMETAAQYSRNADYYRDLVGKIGEMFGEVAKTQDDGGKVDNVLCAKVPELVRAKLARLSACEAALAPFKKLATELERMKVARASRLWLADSNAADLSAGDIYDAAALKEPSDV